ncbi:MAG: DNA translocase FtsK [bacterium]|nr:MAG: DNA translocase FtsK [bacterium]
MDWIKDFLMHRAVKEAFGIFWIAFSIIAVVSLVSYSPADPSLNHAVSGGGHVVDNLAGLGGSYLSDILIQLFGSASFVLPVILLAFGLLFFRSKTFPYASSLLGGGVIFLFAFCTLIFVFSPLDPSYPDTPGGGLLGRISAEIFLVRYLARPGAAIVGISLIFVSFFVATRLSTRQLAEMVKEALVKIFGIVSAAWRKTAALCFMVIRKLQRIKKKIWSKTGSRLASSNDLPVIVKNSAQESSNKKNDEFAARQSAFGFMADASDYSLPPLAYLNNPKPVNREKSEEGLLVNSQILIKKLADFGIEGRVVKVLPGPVITLYEFEPAAGVKVSRIVGLSDDLAMGLRAVSIRILAPVPGKAVVGIEVPNAEVDPVQLKQLLVSDQFRSGNNNYGKKLPLALGCDTSGVPVVTDLAAIPHLLIAGATGSGKSVGLNSMVMSLLYGASPTEVNFIMIDPKMLELSIYDGVPHLIAPVVTNPKKAANALRWTVAEMERRYHLLADRGFRNIAGYNNWVAEQLEEREERKVLKTTVKRKSATKLLDAQADAEEEEELLKPLPYIVVVIDELADLMMVASKDVEDCLARLAQMARASGIHLIVATQRPSVDVLTGLIKANFPARISYQVTSRIDSHTILDAIGAEKLLGKGDLLFLPPGTSRLQRIHGPLVTDEEIKRVVHFLKKQGKPAYNEDILLAPPKGDDAAGNDEEDDEYFEQAVELVANTRQASISMVQRRLRIGYNRAARIIEQMEAKGMVGPSDGAKPRQVFIPQTVGDDVF